MSHHHHGPGSGSAAPPSADASVRPAVAGDAGAVGEVQSALWREAYARLLPEDVLVEMTPDAFARAWEASLAAPPSGAYRLLVALAGPDLVGFAAFGPSSDPDAQDVDGELLVGGVLADSRRNGHGSRLLNAAADLAREAGFVRFRAWLLEADGGTRTFLTDAGFVVDGARRERVVGPAPEDVAAEIRVSADFPE